MIGRGRGAFLIWGHIEEERNLDGAQLGVFLNNLVHFYSGHIVLCALVYGYRAFVCLCVCHKFCERERAW